jgi:hypothetical protein
MQRQTRFSIHACLRAFGYASIIVALLALLYQVLVFMKQGTWQSLNIADATHAMGQDEVYWLPAAGDWPTLNKLMTMVLRIPIWAMGVAVWAAIRLFIGSPKKDETI